MAFWPVWAAAQDFSSLKQPGVVALMRHALAPGTGDPANFDIEDCSTQRNLDDRGRAQARRIGQMMREAGVGFDRIWTSQWCRSRDTAVLLEMGKVREFPPINSHFAGRGDRAAQRQQTLEAIVEQPADARLLLVSHFVNIKALSGQGASSGEIIVTRRSDGGGLGVIDRIEVAP
jgi:phosphohistidine phosphatase SixA